MPPPTSATTQGCQHIHHQPAIAVNRERHCAPAGQRTENPRRQIPRGTVLTANGGPGNGNGNRDGQPNGRGRQAAGTRLVRRVDGTEDNEDENRGPQHPDKNPVASGTIAQPTSDNGRPPDCEEFPKVIAAVIRRQQPANDAVRRFVALQHAMIDPINCRTRGELPGKLGQDVARNRLPGKIGPDRERERHRRIEMRTAQAARQVNRSRNADAPHDGHLEDADLSTGQDRRGHAATAKKDQNERPQRFADKPSRQGGACDTVMPNRESAGVFSPSSLNCSPMARTRSGSSRSSGNAQKRSIRRAIWEATWTKNRFFCSSSAFGTEKGAGSREQKCAVTGWTGKNWAGFPGVVANGDDKIKFHVVKLVPRLAAGIARIDAVMFLQHPQGQRVHCLAGGMRTRAVDREAPAYLLPQQVFADDRTGGIAGAEDPSTTLWERDGS